MSCSGVAHICTHKFYVACPLCCSYDFRSSILEVLAISLVRAALCAVAAFLKKEPLTTAVVAYDLAVLLLTVKPCLS